MTHPSQKTIITTLFPLATTLLVALLLFALQSLWNSTAAHYPSQNTSITPVYQQLFFYSGTIPLLLLFFLALRYLLVKLTKPLFEELDEYRGIHGSFVDMTHLRESDQARQDGRVSEKQNEILYPPYELASLAQDNAHLYDSAKKELNELTKAERLRILSHAVMQCPISVIITDLEGNIEFANPHVAQLTGYEPEELQGKNHHILQSGFTSKTKYKNLWDTILAGGEWRGELQNRKKNGQLYWERVLISPIRDNNGTITHFMAIKEDISDLKIMENQLRHAQKMEAVGQLTGGIAHDFNNILAAIIGYGNILMMKLPAESPFTATAKQILAAAERGASLTQGLLACSRKLASNLTRVDLNATIERVEKLLLNLIGDNIKLVTALTKQPLMVVADNMQMEQVLINLATNVRDAMPEGGTITIRTELVDLDTDLPSFHGIAPKGRYALLTMSDTGHGMDDNMIKSIFDPYYSINGTSKETGLSLSIVHGIIKKHNGHIICNCKPDKGTDFCIYLPIKEEYKTYTAPDPVTLPDQPNGYTVLLVGSDKASNTFTKGLLEEFGYSVIEAEDAGMVLEKYREHQSSIRLVIIDGIITGTKGLKTFREIKATIPIAQIVLCGDPQDSTIKQLNSLNCNLHFISKPFSPKELLMNVREVVKDAV